MSRVLITASIALGATVVLTLPVAAQVTTGTVTGTVTDEQGGVIPGATLVLVSEARGTKSAPAVTSASGDFVIPNVTDDTYTLEVTMSGFKTVKRQGLAVGPGDRVEVPTITLEVGGASETITVTAEGPATQAHSGERSFTVIPEEVQNLPISDRSFSALAGLAPGMSNSGGTNPARLGGAGANNATFDGVGIIDTGSNSIQLQMNVEAVKEIKVLTSNYQAEYGRSSGVQISAVTMSGTNRFRGSIYDVKRNSDWNANSWVNNANGVVKPIDKRDDWGYSIGGPAGKVGGHNKLFFFFSQEWRPRTIGGQVAHYRVPTAAERAGDFSQSRDNNGRLFPYIKDPLINGACNSSSQVACLADGGVLGKIPADRLYPIGLNVLKMWPLPNDDSGYAGSNSYNYTSVKPTVSSHGRQEAFRADYQLSPRLQLSGKTLTQGNTHQPNNSNIRFGTSTTGLIPGFNDMVDWVPLMLTWSSTVDYIVKDSTFFEASYGGFFNQIATTPIDAASDKNNIGLGDFPMLFPDANIIDPRFYSSRILTSLGGHAPPYFVDGRSLIPPTFSWGGRVADTNATPNVTPPNITDFGCCFTLNRVQNVNVSLTRVFGGHTAKMGFYLDHSYKPQTAGVGSTGSYRGNVSFANDGNNPLDSGFGFANAALGVFTSYSQASRFLEGNYVYNNVEWYLQDNWKVNKNLTLDYGLRFVHQGPQYDTYGFSSQFFEQRWDPSKAPVLFQPACATTSPCPVQDRRARNPLTGEVLGPGSISLVGQLVPNSGSLTNGVAPAGTSPNVKENYRWPWLVLAPRFGYAWRPRPRLVFRGGGGLFYDRPDGNSMFGQITNPPASRSVTVNNGMLQGLGDVLGPPGMTIFQFDAKMPSSVHWNSGVQFALPWSSSLDLSYVGLHGYNLLEQTDINAPDFGAAYLPENHNPTVATTAIPGQGALDTNFYRPFRGFGAINRRMTVGVNTFHSLQTSFNRRFSHGTSFTLNYTLSKNAGTNGNGVRITRDANNTIVLRADQEQANYHITGNDRTHVVKASFVWELGSLPRTGAVSSAIGTVINSWRLSGIFTGGSGAPYGIGYHYAGLGNQNLTGTPNYGARMIITGNPGKGCSRDATRQFNTAAFSGPQPGSLGLESGQNYMRGCPNHTLDLAIARSITVGPGRRVVELRADAYNAFNGPIFTNRHTTMEIQNLTTASTATNLPYDADGNLKPSSATPRNAGFGVVTGSNGGRTVQITARFKF